MTTARAVQAAPANGNSPEEVCARLDVLRDRPTVQDDTCVERMRVTMKLDGSELWSLRSECIVSATTLGDAYACNHVGHPDWPLPARLEHPTAPDLGKPNPGTFVPVRIACTCLCLAAAIALAAWARRVGERYPSPRFVGLLRYAFLAIPLVDAVLTVRALTSRSLWLQGEWIAPTLADLAPSALMTAIATLFMLAIARRYRQSGREDLSTHPYRRSVRNG